MATRASAHPPHLDDTHLVSASRDLLPRFCTPCTGDPFASVDLAQQAFLEALERHHELRNPEASQSWLFGIARDQIRLWVRSRGREVFGLHGPDAERELAGDSRWQARDIDLQLDRERDDLAQLPRGLETQLGRDWKGRVELSGGKWQKLALGRAMMPEHPLPQVLDEPTASLNAQTEHDLFARCAEAARRDQGSRHRNRPGFSPVLDGVDGRPDRGAGRQARPGTGESRGAHGARWTLRGAGRVAGSGIPVSVPVAWFGLP